MNFTEILKEIDGFVWGVPLIVLILGTGILLTCRLKLLQMRNWAKLFRYGQATTRLKVK